MAVRLRKMREENLYKKLPLTAGVYLMKNNQGKVLYIGKASNLRKRAASYFGRPQDYRLEKLLNEVKKIEYKKTDTVIEALILESRLIKKFSPPFNVREKDDKSFLYVGITNETFPRVLLVRGKVMAGEGLAPSLTERLENRSARKREERNTRFSAGFGPFTSASSIREALRILRRIFPWSTHPPNKMKWGGHLSKSITRHGVLLMKSCFDYQIGLCPGTCVGAISAQDYLKNIQNLKLIFQGRKKKILENLRREMKLAGRSLEFEKAEKLRKQIFALKHIQDVALLKQESSQLPITNYKLPYRIEGYDISNISGHSAVGSMVVFLGGKPAKSEYRKFKIRTIKKADDVGMLKEVLRRRLGHKEWALPSLILIDGGKGQVSAAREVLNEAGLKIPVVGIAKGAKRRYNKFIGDIASFSDKKTLIRTRDEAHRFAISYHKKLRRSLFYDAK